MGVTDVRFYRWKKLSANLGVAEIRRLKEPKDENYRLEPLVADLTSDKQMLKGLVSQQRLQGSLNRSGRCKSSTRQA